MISDGLLVLDKPSGLTSRAAVDRALRWFPRRTKLGHTGTLDPLATGVLVLCIGKATRLVEYVQRMNKAYHSLFTLGARSSTDDADGEITPISAHDPGLAAIEKGLAGLQGRLEQVPPAFSAAHVEGQRAYDLARRGQDVALTARPVHVYRIEILKYEHPQLEVQVECGKGTYIRSLARDLGAMLGVGAYVSLLRRTRVGPFVPEQATPLEADAPRVLPTALALADLPRVDLHETDVPRLRQGQAVPVAAPDAPEVAVFASDAVVAVARVQGGLLWPDKVLA
jgi:tRNA pseudouridine55 synthase